MPHSCHDNIHIDQSRRPCMARLDWWSLGGLFPSRTCRSWSDSGIYDCFSRCVRLASRSKSKFASKRPICMGKNHIFVEKPRWPTTMGIKTLERHNRRSEGWHYERWLQRGASKHPRSNNDRHKDFHQLPRRGSYIRDRILDISSFRGLETWHFSIFEAGLGPGGPWTNFFSQSVLAGQHLNCWIFARYVISLQLVYLRRSSVAVWQLGTLLRIGQQLQQAKWATLSRNLLIKEAALSYLGECCFMDEEVHQESRVIRYEHRRKGTWSDGIAPASLPIYVACLSTWNRVIFLNQAFTCNVLWSETSHCLIWYVCSKCSKDKEFSTRTNDYPVWGPYIYMW